MIASEPVTGREIINEDENGEGSIAMTQLVHLFCNAADWLALGRSVDSGAQCHHNSAFLGSLSRFDRKLLTENAYDQK